MTEPTQSGYFEPSRPYSPYERSDTPTTFHVGGPPLIVPPAPKPSKLTGSIWIALGAVAIVFFAAGIGAGVFLERGGATNPIRAVTGPGSFTVEGILNLTDTSDPMDTSGSQCAGTGGYDDIADGTQVVVYDATGKSLAIGELTGGVPQGYGTCQFTFEVDHVPAGVGPYSVQVSHRGMIAFTQDDALNLQLSLGS